MVSRFDATDEEIITIGLALADGSMRYEELLHWILDHEI